MIESPDIISRFLFILFFFYPFFIIIVVVVGLIETFQDERMLLIQQLACVIKR